MLALGLLLRRRHARGDVLGHADRVRARLRRDSCSCLSSCRASSLDTITQNVYEELASITLLSIPLFILKGAAIGKSRAGADLYSALHVWMNKRPGRPRHRQRVRVRPVRGDGGLEPGDVLGHRQRRHPGDAQARLLAGLRGRASSPPAGRSASCCRRRSRMILYAVAAEQSLGRLFLAGHRARPPAGGAVRGLCVVALSPRAPAGAGGVQGQAARVSAISTSSTTRSRRRSRCCRGSCRSSSC